MVTTAVTDRVEAPWPGALLAKARQERDAWECEKENVIDYPGRRKEFPITSTYPRLTAGRPV
jgi:hypothetical protein